MDGAGDCGNRPGVCRNISWTHSFDLCVLKVFMYDPSFLDTLYRIFSFLALGLILLAVSYAYQKYKDVILGKA